MKLKQILISSAAAFMLVVAGAAVAGAHTDAQAKTEKMLKEEAGMISGAGDVNPDAAQIKAPDPSAAAQEKTEKMLKEEAGMISGDGDVNPDAAQIKAPDPSAAAQEKTEKMLKEEASEISGQK